MTEELEENKQHSAVWPIIKICLQFVVPSVIVISMGSVALYKIDKLEEQIWLVAADTEKSIAAINASEAITEWDGLQEGIQAMEERLAEVESKDAWFNQRIVEAPERYLRLERFKDFEMQLNERISQLRDDMNRLEEDVNRHLFIRQ